MWRGTSYLQSFGNSQSPSETPLGDNNDDTADRDPTFEAIQISQIIALQCEILKDQISEGNKQQAIEIVDSLSKRAIRIGKMMKRFRMKGSKEEQSP
jgi:hypothetical protein